MNAPPRHPLQVWLEANDVSQAELAKRAGTFQPRISMFLAGDTSFSAQLAARIRAVTGISLDDLLLKTPQQALRREASKASEARPRLRKAAGAR